MEGEINSVRPRQCLIFILVVLLGIGFPARGYNQGASSGQAEEKAQLRLRKTVKAGRYKGRSVEGEERVIVPGDSLWRILIHEKGLSKKRFPRYLVLIKSLNPQLKSPDLLRVGDVIFVPIRPDEILGIGMPSGKRGSQLYRIKRGEFLFKILQEHLGLRGKKEIRSAFNQVKELNPRKKNWDLLFVGELILLPSLREGEPPAVTIKPAKEFVGLDYGLKLPVRENLHLLQEVLGVAGGVMTREGEEELALKEGTIHLDRSLFPVIQNSRLGEKLVLNMDEIVVPPILTQLESENPEIGIVSIKKGKSLHEAANTLFSQLGFQTLPSDRPVVLHDRGVGLQVKGEWMVANPDRGGGRQELWIISLADGSGTTPEYLKEYLSFRGMNLKEILLPSSPVPASLSRKRKTRETGNEVETWPSDKKALVDTFFRAVQVPFVKDHKVSFSLREGIRLQTKIDRYFLIGVTKFGVLFRPVGGALKEALEKGKGIKAIELDLESLSSRQIISRLLAAVGEGSAYQEHRFPVVERGAKDKLVLAVSGFFLPNRSLLLTDRTIPREVQRFFFEKGLRLISFQ